VSEFLSENISYYISNVVLLLVFSFFYTLFKLKVFRANNFFLKEFLKNFFAGIVIYIIYILFLFSKQL